MRTFLLMAALIIFGIIAKNIFPFILNILNLPGRFIAFPNTSGESSRSRFIFGTIVTTILQSYVYLTYTAFVASWTMLGIRKQGDSVIVLLAALFAVIFPLGAVSIDARIKAEAAARLYRGRLDEFAQHKANQREKVLNMAVWASSTTFTLSLVAFVVFVFIPKAAEIVCGWIPFKVFH